MVIVFAADKANLQKLEEQIATAIQDHNIQADLARTEAAQIGMIPDTVEIGRRTGRIPLIQWRWRVPVAGDPDETTIKALRKSLSGLEVQDVHIK